MAVGKIESVFIVQCMRFHVPVVTVIPVRQMDIIIPWECLMVHFGRYRITHPGIRPAFIVLIPLDTVLINDTEDLVRIGHVAIGQAVGKIELRHCASVDHRRDTSDQVGGGALARTSEKVVCHATHGLGRRGTAFTPYFVIGDGRTYAKFRRSALGLLIGSYCGTERSPVVLDREGTVVFHIERAAMLVLPVQTDCHARVIKFSQRSSGSTTGRPGATGRAGGGKRIGVLDRAGGCRSRHGIEHNLDSRRILVRYETLRTTDQFIDRYSFVLAIVQIRSVDYPGVFYRLCASVTRRQQRACRQAEFIPYGFHTSPK